MGDIRKVLTLKGRQLIDSRVQVFAGSAVGGDYTIDWSNKEHASEVDFGKTGGGHICTIRTTDLRTLGEAMVFAADKIEEMDAHISGMQERYEGLEQPVVEGDDGQE